MHVHARTLIAFFVATCMGAPAAFAQDDDGCTRDTECKGDRICEEGICVAPPAPEVASAASVEVQAPTAPPAVSSAPAAWRHRSGYSGAILGAVDFASPSGESSTELGLLTSFSLGQYLASSRLGSLAVVGLFENTLLDNEASTNISVLGVGLKYVEPKNDSFLQVGVGPAFLGDLVGYGFTADWFISKNSFGLALMASVVQFPEAIDLRIYQFGVGLGYHR